MVFKHPFNLKYYVLVIILQVSKIRTTISVSHKPFPILSTSAQPAYMGPPSRKINYIVATR